MTLKILVEENLSPTLVDLLLAKGVFAQHVVHLGRDGASDPELWRYAFCPSAGAIDEMSG